MQLVEPITTTHATPAAIDTHFVRDTVAELTDSVRRGLERARTTAEHAGDHEQEWLISLLSGLPSAQSILTIELEKAVYGEQVHSPDAHHPILMLHDALVGSAPPLAVDALTLPGHPIELRQRLTSAKNEILHQFYAMPLPQVAESLRPSVQASYMENLVTTPAARVCELAMDKLNYRPRLAK